MTGIEDEPVTAGQHRRDVVEQVPGQVTDDAADPALGVQMRAGSWTTPRSDNASNVRYTLARCTEASTAATASTTSSARR
jgi:hypothetical protein